MQLLLCRGPSAPQRHVRSIKALLYTCLYTLWRFQEAEKIRYQEERQLEEQRAQVGIGLQAPAL